MTKIDLDGLLAIREASEASGYSQDYLRRLAREGTVRAQRIADRWLFDRDDLLRHKTEMDALGKMKHAPKATRGGGDDR